MIPSKTIEVIEGALRSGAKLHAFLSGGGLRVLSLDLDGKRVGYGEHPNVEEAFTHLAEDFEAGNRPYKEVYGKLHTHYLTGSSETTSALDAWVCQGSKFDAYEQDGLFVFVLSGHGHTEMSKDMEERATNGETIRWSHRGYTFESWPSVFPGNGEKCCVTSILESPEGRGGADPWMYPITKTGRAEVLVEAIAKAFEAEEIE